MSIELAYRMTVYAGIYSDETDTTVLTPASGAPHSQEFKVTTRQGVSGFQPFMNPPRGKRGSLRVPDQKLEVGSYTVELIDKRTGTDNINRWVTAFFGNSQGKFTLIGKKAFIEESVDGGVNWSPFFVGQVSDVNLTSATKVSLVIKDNVMFLKDNIFKTHPRVDYAIYKGFVPIGLNRDVKNENNEVVIPRPEGLEVSIIGKENYIFGQSAFCTISTKSRNLPRNIWPIETQFYSGNSRVTDFYFSGNFPVRAVVEVNGTPYVFGVLRVFTPGNSTANNSSPAIDVVELWLLPPWEQNAATSMDVLPTGRNLTNVRMWMYKYEDTSDANGFWLNGEWNQVVADVLDGKFYEPLATSIGAVTKARKTAYNSGSLHSVKVDRRIPKPNFFVNKSMSALEFLERYAFAPYSVGYTFEPVVNGGVPSCQLRVFSTAQPTTLTGLRTISGSEVQATMPEWTVEQPVSFVSAKYYEEYETRVTANSSENSKEQSAPTKAVEHTYVAANSTDGNVVLNSDIKKIELDMNGVRSFVPLASQTNTYYGVTPQAFTETRAQEFANSVFHRFKSGITTTLLRTLRTTNTNAIAVGDYVLVEVEVLPNQATRTRGGSRLMQVLNKYGMGTLWEFELLDSGVNSAMSAPTVGTPTTPNRAEVQVSITTTQRALVEVQYAATDTGASQPSSDSGLWTFGVQRLINNTSSTVTLSGLPEGRRIWVRARSVAPVDEGLRLNSQWVVGGSVVLSNIAVPTSVSVDRITSRSARVQWTNTDTDLSVQIWLASPAGTPDTQIAVLPPSSTSYVLRGLDKNTSTSHRVGIRYFDQYEGNGAFATADFTATGTPPTLDAPAAILLYVSR